MRLTKQAAKRQKLEEDIKRLKLRGYSSRDIAEKLGLTENRVNDILFQSLTSSKLLLNQHNERAHKAGLPGFDIAKVSTDFSSLQALGDAVKNYQKQNEI